MVGAAALVAYAILLVATAITSRRDAAEVDASADRFVAAYERSLQATYALEGSFTRRSVTTENQIGSEFTEAQRPPSRRRDQFGGVSGRDARRVFSCDAERAGAAGDRCAFAPVLDYEDEVAERVTVLRQYFDDADPLYTVVEDGECFELRRTRYDPRPPYGEAARLCFDRATGALARVRVENTGVIDETIATEIRSAVTDAELEPPS
jgi:hypothetical protein